MKRVILAIAIVLLCATAASALWKMNPFTGKLDYYESGITSSGTGTNVLGWDFSLITGQTITYQFPAGTTSATRYAPTDVAALSYLVSSSTNTRWRFVPYTGNWTKVYLSCETSGNATVTLAYSTQIATSGTWTTIGSNSISNGTSTTAATISVTTPANSYIRSLTSGVTASCTVGLSGTGY